jgi:hypothetical protein
MYNTREGDYFMPPGLQSETLSGNPAFNSSEASFDSWLRGYLPSFSDDYINRIKNLYPKVGKSERLSYNDTFTRASLIYRDSVLACPALWLANLAAKGGWVSEFSIPPANHATDTEWVSLFRSRFLIFNTGVRCFSLICPKYKMQLK